MGTPSYKAPEQAQDKTRQIGPAADIYALGPILYELLTGRPPFRGETTWETLQQVVTEPPVPPSRRQPGVPPELEATCLKCLQKDQAARYPSAEALADDLRCFLAGQPTEAQPESPPPPRTGGRKRALVLVAPAVSLGILLRLLAHDNWLPNLLISAVLAGYRA